MEDLVNRQVDGLNQYPKTEADVISDYGSELDTDDELELNRLLLALPLQLPTGRRPLSRLFLDNEPARTAGINNASERGRRETSENEEQSRLRMGNVPAHIQVKTEDDIDTTCFEDTLKRRVNDLLPPADRITDLEVEDNVSPLLRFRTAPRKALSVSDLVSPAWCELQYWYSLTKHGRKRRTPAMKQGTILHQKLEEEVHQTVHIDVTTREDSWALRIWNIIQGLRSLQQTGITRELEVWGFIDGQVINGVIDELSHTCPDRELELQTQSDARQTQVLHSKPIPRTIIDDFLRAPVDSSVTKKKSHNFGVLATRSRKVYITDVKTRASKTLPKSSGFRPTLMQLMLYHRLFSDLVSNKVDAEQLFRRYDLDTSASFTDSVIAQLSQLDDGLYFSPPPKPTQSKSALYPGLEALEALTSHNSLIQLWSLLMRTCQQVFPDGADSISQILHAEYRNPIDGTIQGSKTFIYNDDILGQYLGDKFSWWKGERKAVGVPEDEAYKCRMCEFANDCTWRLAKVEEATTAFRRKTSPVSQESTSR